MILIVLLVIAVILAAGVYYWSCCMPVPLYVAKKGADLYMSRDQAMALAKELGANVATFNQLVLAQKYLGYHLCLAGFVSDRPTSYIAMQVPYAGCGPAGISPAGERGQVFLVGKVPKNVPAGVTYTEFEVIKK